ncbi:MAG: hypothetical protein K2G64_06465 [Muribaculaceae bacterium]|nr:hypothetical protein [Muribaculaceae bacterium]MDE5968730.1 hypothetical protein [Muribaculaceae bacterium]MDE7393515.1 hypothetical protein [Muribaculaceae bacterium]
MMSISPAIPLTLGCLAGALFLICFAVALIVTMRNRKIIHRQACENRRVKAA